MKGVIALCLKEMVEEKFGREKWEEVLAQAGLPADTIFLAAEDVPDEVIMKAVWSACSVIGENIEEAADAFGDYWVNVYSQRVYPSFYRANSTARGLILDMDRVHDEITKSVKNARPPHFEFEWKDPKTLIVGYRSKRGMMDFAVGLLRGVGRFYKEDIKVRKLSDDKIEVLFP